MPGTEVSPARQLFGTIAPKIGEITDDLLFADVWERPELSKRDRSVVTVAALIALGDTQQLPGHVRRALRNGVTGTEVSEMLTHLVLYVGLPRSTSAFRIAREAIEDAAPSASVAASVAASVGVAQPAQRAETASPAHQMFGALAPKMADILDDVLFADIWERPDLSKRDRSMVTLAALVALGSTETLTGYVRRAQRDGLTGVEMGEMLTHLAFYSGLPRSTSAYRVVSDVLGEARQ